MTRALVVIALVVVMVRGSVRLVEALRGPLSSVWSEYQAHRAAAAQEWFAEAWTSRRPHAQIARFRYVHNARDTLIALR
jgi:hypothetical protein